MKLLVGADPEVFVKNPGGKVVSAHGLIPGTKSTPYCVEKGAVQVDGMAAEFNIDPASTEDEFSEGIFHVLNTLDTMLGENSVFISPSVFFKENYLKRQPEESVIMGCDPDFNAYTGKENVPPPEGSLMRSGAGHVHIGWTEGHDIQDPMHFDACMMLARQLDWFLGVPSLLFDTCDDRRKQYGMCGAFRPKPYGMEYRTLSNCWLKNSQLVRWVYRNSVSAFDRLFGGDQVLDDVGDSVSRFFDGSFTIRQEAVQSYCNSVNIELPPVDLWIEDD